VGNFTVCRPLRLSLPAATDLDTASKAVAQARGATPPGVGFAALRWMSEFPSQQPILPDPQLRVRLVDGLDQGVREDCPLTVRTPYPIERRDPAEQRTAVLDIEAVLVAGRLEITVGYSANLHTERTARDFAEGIAATVREAAELIDLDDVAGG
jgi:yersiniabactin nonribosomal peptide synthetase